MSRAVSSLTGWGGAFSVRAPSDQGRPCLRNGFSESQRQNLAQPPWSPTTAGMDLDTGPLGVGAREGLHFKFPQFCTAWESVWKAGKCRTQWESPPDSPHTGPVSLRHRQEAKPRLKPAPPGQSRSLTSASGGRRLPGCHIGSSRDLAGASRLHPAARHPPPLGVERPSWHVHGRGPADPWPRSSGRGADVGTANAGPSSLLLRRRGLEPWASVQKQSTGSKDKRRRNSQYRGCCPPALATQAAGSVDRARLAKVLTQTRKAQPPPGRIPGLTVNREALGTSFPLLHRELPP